MPESSAPSMTSSLLSVLRYWEARRIVFNLVVTAALTGASAFALRERFSFPALVLLYFVPGVAANIAYSVVYLIELAAAVIEPDAGDVWRRPVFYAGLVLTTLVAVAMGLAMRGDELQIMDP